MKKNLVIILAFALPIALIIVVGLSVYLPSASLSTDYNFVYIACTDREDYYSGQCSKYLKDRYSVVNEKIVEQQVDLEEYSDEEDIRNINRQSVARIFLHDTSTNESREITLEEAQTLKLNKLFTSPDGITIANHRDKSPEFFPFFNGTSSYGRYLTKGESKSNKKLNIYTNSQYHFSKNFYLIGWVLPGRNQSK